MSKIIRIKQVSELTGLARSTIYDLIDAGRFPRQVKLGARSVGWRIEDIEAWIAARPTVQKRKLAEKGLPRLPAGRVV